MLTLGNAVIAPNYGDESGDKIRSKQKKRSQIAQITIPLNIPDVRVLTTQEFDWHDKNSPQSFLYDNHLLSQLVNSPVGDVSLKEGQGY